MIIQVNQNMAAFKISTIINVFLLFIAIIQDSKSTCPLWHAVERKGKCNCFDKLDGSIECDSGRDLECDKWYVLNMG